MKPGYYMLKPMGYPIEVVGDGEYLTMSGDEFDMHIKPDALEAASLKEILQWGGNFDDEKIITRQIAWASSPDAEEWHFAADEDDALGQAADADLSEIWIDDNPCPADPREVVPTGESILEAMLDNSYGDVSTFWAAQEMGWLEKVTKEEYRDLDEILKRVICNWMIGHGHWPAGFICSGQKARRVKVSSTQDRPGVSVSAR